MSARSLLTFARFERLPDAPGKREILDGELIELPPPKFRLNQISERLYDVLRSSPIGSRAHFEAGCRIGGGWLQPDVSAIWREQQVIEGYLAASPMVAIEVLSPRRQ